MPAHDPRDDVAASADVLSAAHHGIVGKSEVRVVSREAARTGAPRDAHEMVSIVATETAREREKRLIGANVKRYRETRGWTQEELAGATGVDRTQIVRWERGVWKPDPEHMERLARMLGVTLADFYHEEVAA